MSRAIRSGVENIRLTDSSTEEHEGEAGEILPLFYLTSRSSAIEGRSVFATIIS